MRIVVLTGAGISAESGLATFRASDGLWENYPLEDIATPEAFARDPALVHEFYNMRRMKAAEAQPNAAHFALAELAAVHELTIITQNVDDLHERGGSLLVIHMHGSLKGALCAACGFRWPAPMTMHAHDKCRHCNAAATRPDIVWFGETPYQMEKIWSALDEAELFVAIGTSGNVYPAAAFAQIAARKGAECVEFNLEESANSRDFNKRVIGPATLTVPEWVATLI